MFALIISNTKWCHSVGCPCNFIGTCLFCFCWQMLLPLLFTNLAGFIANFLLTKVGRCYCHLFVVDLKPLLWLFYGQKL